MTEGPNVVRLPAETRPPDPPPPSAPGRMHGWAIAGMGISALVGVTAMLALITVTWPQSLGRVVVGVLIVAGLLFMTFASTAVFTAARDTYRGSEARRSHE